MKRILVFVFVAFAGSALSAPAIIPPVAFTRFCLNSPGQCETARPGDRIILTARAWKDLRRVNDRINARIMPDSGRDPWHWSLDTIAGNCNDYAVQKRAALLAMGYPMRALTLTAVRTSRGQDHLVLIVRTDLGDMVLDNLRPAVLPIIDARYFVVARQSESDPGQWHRPARIGAGVAVNTAMESIGPIPPHLLAKSLNFMVSWKALCAHHIGFLGLYGIENKEDFLRCGDED